MFSKKTWKGLDEIFDAIVFLVVSQTEKIEIQNFMKKSELLTALILLIDDFFANESQAFLVKIWKEWNLRDIFNMFRSAYFFHKYCMARLQ